MLVAPRTDLKTNNLEAIKRSLKKPKTEKLPKAPSHHQSETNEVTREVGTGMKAKQPRLATSECIQQKDSSKGTVNF